MAQFQFPPAMMQQCMMMMMAQMQGMPPMLPTGTAPFYRLIRVLFRILLPQSPRAVTDASPLLLPLRLLPTTCLVRSSSSRKL